MRTYRYDFASEFDDDEDRGELDEDADDRHEVNPCSEYQRYVYDLDNVDE